MNPHPKGMYIPFGIRDSSIREVINMVIPVPDSEDETDDRMLQFKEYVKYAERLRFNRSSSPEQYEQTMAIWKSIVSQKASVLRPLDPLNPYDRIPATHLLSMFVGLTEAEVKDSKLTLIPAIRRDVIDALASHVFPPPEGTANTEARIKRVIKKVTYHEKIVYAQADTIDEYYHKLATDLHRVKTTMRVPF